jgi:hypothetical protein
LIAGPQVRNVATLRRQRFATRPIPAQTERIALASH